MSKADNTLRLNSEDRKILGVCSGFARYLDVPSALVRLIYIVACVVSPALILVYFVMYWLMKEDATPSKVRVYVSESEPAQRFRRIDYNRPLYRTKGSGARIGGVCGGIAEYLNISPFIVRLATFLSLFILGAVTFWAYIICWIVLDKKPRGFSHDTAKAGPEDLSEAETQASPGDSLEDCAGILNRSEARLRELEAYMTSRRFRLHCEINRI